MKIGDPLDRSVAHGPQNHRCVPRWLCNSTAITLGVVCCTL